jgi:hypothetical protein
MHSGHIIVDMQELWSVPLQILTARTLLYLQVCCEL